MSQTVQEFNEERNAVLLTGDVEQFRAFGCRNGHKWETASHEILEISMHQARTAIVALPRSNRQESWRWLTERGLETLDDGDLFDET